jgi:hypothetical protein
MLRKVERRIGVIENVVTDGKVELYGLLDGLLAATGRFQGIIPDTSMVAINNGRGT